MNHQNNSHWNPIEIAFNPYWWWWNPIKIPLNLIVHGHIMPYLKSTSQSNSILRQHRTRSRSNLDVHQQDMDTFQSLAISRDLVNMTSQRIIKCPKNLRMWKNMIIMLSHTIPKNIKHTVLRLNKYSCKQTSTHLSNYDVSFGGSWIQIAKMIDSVGERGERVPVEHLKLQN